MPTYSLLELEKTYLFIVVADSASYSHLNISLNKTICLYMLNLMLLLFAYIDDILYVLLMALIPPL